MGQDRRPPSSRSPWEGIGRPSNRSEPRDPYGGDRVTNANAPGTQGWEGKSSKEVMAAMEEMMMDMAMPFSGQFTIDATHMGHPWGGRSATGSARERLEAEERRLRPAIEKWLLKTSPGVAWDDVIGNDTARQHLIEAIEHPIRHAELYRHYGKKPTKGVLLYGPPGCGKTMFGKAAASVLAQLHGTKSASLLSIKGNEIQSPYVGGTEQSIRAIFAYARAYQALHGYPLVVFIDEADAILPSRDGAGGRRIYGYEEAQVATFLTEMDGLEASGALVILATNRPEAIDAAILRDGRCDRKIRVERPDRRTAAAILERALAGIPVAGEEDQASHGVVARRQALADEAAQAVFAPEQVIAPLATDVGPRVMRLSDIVNGAMLVGIVEQAKGSAFRRDLAAGGVPSGLTQADLDLAVISVVKQNRGMNHTTALQEIAERDGLKAVQVLLKSATPLRYTLDADDNVVPIQ